ncbi:Uncharacterised protein (plasmid) [Tsukamurella tyrosinosolvens]|uniref:Uncharacterized protein n=1 Tax=Tsukamurella tyrosinosolvens TaxID=57704 RepID=A0A1H4VIT1_TSUTY|nr:hypothetical protein SAMN04489793_3240 [Tsukamurella tyrosinosolvens]VEH90493.1 Uncharacterised protein [Tsukamurella tyrosinosolvens]
MVDSPWRSWPSDAVERAMDSLSDTTELWRDMAAELDHRRKAESAHELTEPSV